MFKTGRHVLAYQPRGCHVPTTDNTVNRQPLYALLARKGKNVEHHQAAM